MTCLNLKKSKTFFYRLELLPQFEVVMDRSDGNGIPLINVKFPNGHEDTMYLERYFSSPEDRNSNDCNFIGHLVNDQSACVAVTGCYGKEDLEMTIMSQNVGLIL